MSEPTQTEDIKESIQDEGDSFAPVSKAIFNHEELQIQKPLRILNHKRQTALMYSKQSGYLVCKLFFGRKAKLNYEKELEGILALQKHHVPTLTVMMHGICKLPKNTYLIAYPFLEKSQTLFEHSESHLAQLFQEFSKMHQVGLYQDDCHFGNFLLYEGQVILIDGDGIRQSKSNRKDALKNAAMLLAQLNVAYQPDAIKLFFKHYDAYDFDEVEIEQAVIKANQKRAEIIQEKVIRSSSLVDVFKEQRNFFYRNRQDLIPLEELKKAIQEPEDDDKFFKKGNSATVWRYQDLVVKRYNIKNIQKKMSRIFKKHRAQNAWEFSFVLNKFGINAPAPVASVEKFSMGLLDVVYLVTKHQEGALLSEKLKEDKSFWQKKGEALLENLCSLGLAHGDMKATNVIVDSNDELHIFDLDVMCFSGEKAQQKDRVRFLKNFS